MISTRLGYTDPELCFGIHGMNVLQRASTRGTDKNKHKLENVMIALDRTYTCYYSTISNRDVPGKFTLKLEA
jgi:hypothetical protein